MEIDNFSARTLSELPTHPAAYRRDVYRHTCLDLKSFCHADLVKHRRAELLEQYLDWLVIKDRATLDNAPRLEVRKHFNRWVSEQNVPKFLAKAKHVPHPAAPLPFQEANNGTALFLSQLPPMVFAIIDRTWTPNGTEDNFDVCKAVKEENEEEEDDDEQEDNEEDEYERDLPRIDGSDRRYIGWMYCNALYVGGLYEQLLQEGLDDDDSYRYPPAIHPRGSRWMPSITATRSDSVKGDWEVIKKQDRNSIKIVVLVVPH
ncbi:hypothetical protein CI238_09129 [Colletotrichum incanum]|uniref:Uncharacterized protein n=1 Tax=Colletotrichum incanum TaxID=1573173 RepID=A0A162NN91_COLIC|nr:hypothetical protein CI238_09129 [Colletotrichum incanum]